MKKRLDVLLVEKGLVESRQKAQALIMAGQVYVKEQKVDKAGTPVDPEAAIEVRGGGLKYVSRGGYKLEKAMDTWPIALQDKVCADIGASTGGIYRLYAPKRGGEGFFCGCGLWPVCLETAKRPPGGLLGADQRPVSHHGTDS